MSWPLGFIQLAKGASRVFVLTETTTIALWLGLVVVLVPPFGVVGTAYAFALVYVFYSLVMLAASRHLIGFRWSRSVKKVVSVVRHDGRFELWFDVNRSWMDCQCGRRYFDSGW